MTKEGKEKHSGEETYNFFKKNWEDYDPTFSPLLSECRHLEIGETFAAAYPPALPFHHLVSAEHLIPASKNQPPWFSNPKTEAQSKQRLKTFWECLIAQGYNAKETAFLDNYISCNYFEFIEHTVLFGIIWKVSYHDELQGCAEIYRAEMLSLKQMIYNAGNNLSKYIEISEDDFLKYLNTSTSWLLHSDKWSELFLGNLGISFHLFVGKYKITSENRDRKFCKTGRSKSLKERQNQQL